LLMNENRLILRGKERGKKVLEQKQIWGSPGASTDRRWSVCVTLLLVKSFLSLLLLDLMMVVMVMVILMEAERVTVILTGEEIVIVRVRMRMK